MPYTPLSAVKHRLQVGAPLPFNVRHHDGTLLLARGQPIDSHEQLAALCERGTLVDLAELLSPRDEILNAPRQSLPGLWKQTMQRVHGALLHAPHHAFKSALDDACAPVVALVERDPDLAIFQVLRRDANPDVAYGVQRSLHTAITCWLVAHRLNWTPAELERVFKAALTSNLSMLELQGQLAVQRTPPTSEQLAALQTHPRRSRDLLELAGVQDRDWLDAVERHHEREDGGGYPTGRTDVGDLASLVRRADVYTSKLSSRAHREAMPADRAGREMFMEDPGHPMIAALVKEFGIYPPGSFVQLSNGATGVVVRRGPTVTTPVVALLTNERGASLAEPLRVDTSRPGFAIEAIVGESHLPAPVSGERLMRLTVS